MINMVKKLTILALLLSIMVTGCIDEMTVEKIATHTQEKYESVDDFKATMIVTTNVQGAEERDKVDISIKKPNKFKSEDKKRGIITVSNGKVTWVYDVKKGEATKASLEGSGSMPDFDYGQIISSLLINNDVTLVGEDKLGGMSCYVIEASPKKETYLIRQRIWIDKKYWFPIRIETDFGDFKSSVEYTNISINSGISDDEFEFVPPEGVKIVEPEISFLDQLSMEEAQNSVNFTILKPSYTADYNLMGANIGASGKSVSLTYTKEGKILTITQSQKKHPLQNAENISVGGAKGELLDVFGSKMLRFDSNDTEIMITGTMTKEELIKIAESIN